MGIIFKLTINSNKPPIKPSFQGKSIIAQNPDFKSTDGSTQLLKSPIADKQITMQTKVINRKMIMCFNNQPRPSSTSGLTLTALKGGHPTTENNINDSYRPTSAGVMLLKAVPKKVIEKQIRNNVFERPHTVSQTCARRLIQILPKISTTKQSRSTICDLIKSNVKSGQALPRRIYSIERVEIANNKNIYKNASKKLTVLDL